MPADAAADGRGRQGPACGRFAMSQIAATTVSAPRISRPSNPRGDQLSCCSSGLLVPCGGSSSIMRWPGNAAQGKGEVVHGMRFLVGGERCYARFRHVPICSFAQAVGPYRRQSLCLLRLGQALTRHFKFRRSAGVQRGYRFLRSQLIPGVPPCQTPSKPRAPYATSSALPSSKTMESGCTSPAAVVAS